MARCHRWNDSMVRNYLINAFSREPFIMKRIEYGFINEVDRDDHSKSDKWHFIGESIDDLIEFLNDCDCSDATPLSANDLSNIWLRVIDE